LAYVDYSSNFTLDLFFTFLHANQLGANDEHLYDTIAVEHNINTSTIDGTHKFGDASAGDYAEFIGVAGPYVDISALAKIFEVKIIRGGEFTIKYIVDHTGGLSYTSQIYRNGSAVGTLNSGDGTYTEDISGWAKDDLLQVYADGAAFDGARVSDLLLCVSTPITEHGQNKDFIA